MTFEESQPIAWGGGAAANGVLIPIPTSDLHVHIGRSEAKRTKLQFVGQSESDRSVPFVRSFDAYITEAYTHYIATCPISQISH